MALHGKGGCSVGAGVEDDVEVDVGVGGCVSLVCRCALHWTCHYAGHRWAPLGKPVARCRSWGPQPRRDQVAASKHGPC